MAESGTSSAYKQQDIINKVADMPQDIKAMVTEKALAAFSSEEMMSFEAVLHRRYGDQSLHLEVLHPKYPYMMVLRPLLYSFPPPLMALMRYAMASNTVAIELDVRFLKTALRLRGTVTEAQLEVCDNLLRFLKWLLPLSQWKEEGRNRTGCVVVICSRKLQCNAQGYVAYSPKVHEVIHIKSTIYTVGDEFLNIRRAVMQKIWEANNEAYPWRSDWDAVDRHGPWNKFSVAYGLQLKPRFMDWYMGLTVFEIAIKWRQSRVVRSYEKEHRRLFKQYPQIATILANDEPWANSQMTTAHLDLGN